MILEIILIVIFIIIYVATKLKASHADSVSCLVGKTAIVTGGNSGIGYNVSLLLASRGCRVIIADIADAEESKKKIIEQTNNKNVLVKHLNLASYKSVRAFADDIIKTEDRLDILINNAGIGVSPTTRKSEDGMNLCMQVNYFGSFLLTHLLVGLLKKSAPSRIIFTSSSLAFWNNLTTENLDGSLDAKNFLKIYSNSKICNIIAADGFAEKLKKFGVTSNAADPGTVRTPIFTEPSAKVSRFGFLHISADIWLFLMATHPYLGCQTVFHVATSKKLENETGKNFLYCRKFIKPKFALDENKCKEIWRLSEKYTCLADNEKLL